MPLLSHHCFMEDDIELNISVFDSYNSDQKKEEKRVIMNIVT